MTSGDLLRRIAGAFRRAELLPEAGAIDYERVRVSQGSGGHGKHGATSTVPYADSLVLDWLDRFERLTVAFERDLREATVGAVRTSKVDKRRDARIVSRTYEGRPHSWVAFIEGCSESHVVKKRKAAQLDERGFRTPKASVLTNTDPEGITQ